MLGAPGATAASTDLSLTKITGNTFQTGAITNTTPLRVQANTSFTLTVNIGSAAAPTVTNVLTLAYRGDNNLSNNTATVPSTVSQ